MDKPTLYLINGPLGAGKTTLLRHLVQQSEFATARVIENEFASTSIDTAQLHDHIDEVRTIAGVCICCSTGDELTSALNELATSTEPVIIEATGVANSLVLLEKLIVADIFNTYIFGGGLFVLDATEATPATLDAYMHELRAADRVLVTKTDLLKEGEATSLQETLTAMGVRAIHRVTEGRFAVRDMPQQSHMLEYFAGHTDAFTTHDATVNYMVVQLDGYMLDDEKLAMQWPDLVKRYGLKRLKGDFKNMHGEMLHIEATPSQCRIAQQPLVTTPCVLVAIGERALEIDRVALGATEAL